jgi:hypothetical protein
MVQGVRPRSPIATSVSGVGETVAGGAESFPQLGPLHRPRTDGPFSGGGGKRGTAVSAQFLRRPHTGKLRNCLTLLRPASGGFSYDA